MNSAAGKRKIKIFLIMLAFILLAAGWRVPIENVCAHSANFKNVLVIHSYDANYIWTADENKGILDALKKCECNIYTDYMDMKKINFDSYCEKLRDFQKIKYNGVKFDVIICSDNDALKYLVKYGKEIYGTTPVVFCGINNFDKSMTDGYENITGVVQNCDYRDTIEGMLKMQPNLKTIFVLSTDSLTSSLEREEVEALAENYKNIDFVFENNIEESGLKDFNAFDSNMAAILMLSDPIAFNGVPVPLDAIESNNINNINLPVYVLSDFVVGKGAVGGKVVSGYNQGLKAGMLAAEILQGAKVSDLPIIEKSPNMYLYDYKVMKRFGISKAAIPQGSTIINEPFSVVWKYKWIAAVMTGVFAAMAALILLLIVNIRKRKETEERFKLALQGSNDAIWEYDIQNNKFYASEKWTQMTGYRNEVALVPWKHIEYIHPDDRDKVLKMLNELKNEKDSFTAEFRFKVSSGEYKWLQMKGQVILNKKRGLTAYGYVSDISTRKKYEHEISFLAYYDKLTGLMNRAAIMDKLEEKLRDMKACNEKGAVYFVDLDDFKRVNDTLGHDYGDMLLKEAAVKLKEYAGEKSFVGRLSGDEFLVIRYDAKDMREIANLARDLTKAFGKSFTIAEKQIYVTASVGVAIYPDDGTDPETLLKNSDTAMYKAKQSGKNKFKFYNKKMYKDLLRKAEIEKELREVLSKDALTLEYHPYFDIETRKITGLEALLRWKSEKLGYVPPDEFIAIAEETGLIIDIGKWVLEKACRQNMIWKSQGLDNVFISVNISPVQISEPGFYEIVKDILNATGLAPEFLGIEIKESLISARSEGNLMDLERLSEEGVTIYLDDFGTGYSSLTYLTKAPLDGIKIDRSLIDSLTYSIKAEDVIHGIIDLAHKIRLKVIAEGVSKQEQYEILKKLGCDEIQGFLISDVKPAEEIIEMIKKHI